MERNTTLGLLTRLFKGNARHSARAAQATSRQLPSRALLVLLISGVTCALFWSTAAIASAATLTTDKADYKPEEVVHISGTGFNPGETYAMPVKRPDGSIVLVDPILHFATPGWGFAVADGAGNLSYDYQLDGVAGSYESRAYPLVWSGDWSEAPVASVTFDDASASLEQCQNGKVGPPLVLDPCAGTNWVTGNVGGSKAHWREGEFLSYRDTIDIGAAGTHTFQLHYDTVVSGLHAIDYLGSFDTTETTSPTATAFHANNSDPCGDILPAINCDPSAPASSYPIPPANLTNCNGSLGTAPTQIAGSMKIFGDNSPVITGVSYVAENVAGGGGSCTTSIAITFTTTGPGTVVLAWGGHIASEAEWGNGNSATFISGSNYHMHQDSLVSNGVNQNGVGSQDRSLSTSAVVFTPSITTDIKKNSDGSSVTFGSVPVGTTVHDTSTLTGASSNADGTVTYKRFTTIDCTGTSTDEDVDVTNRVVPNSADFTPTTAGSYSYQAVYSGTNGDPINLGATSPCEPLTVTAVAATVKTAIHDTDHNVVLSVPLGATVHDSVSVTGSAGTASGDVTFDFFNNGTCADTAADTSGSFTLTGGSVDATTFTQGPLAAGSYSFKAHYGGGGNYGSADSDCEPLTVKKAQLDIDTQVHDPGHADITDGSVALGTKVHDVAQVSGNVSGFATGGVTFTFYSSDDPANPCKTGSAIATSATDESGDPRSIDTGNLAAGTYGFKATVADNSNYDGKTGACEPFTVNRAQLDIDTQVHDPSHADITNGSVALGTIVHDVAQVSGNVSGFSTGGVTFTFYSSDDPDAPCTNGARIATSATDEGGDPRSIDTGNLAAGTYGFKATLSDSANYDGKTGACEPFTVNRAQLDIDTQVHDPSHADITDGSVALGTIVHDVAQVSGNVSGFSTGGVIFTFYSSDDPDAPCTNGARIATSATDEGGDPRSIDTGNLAAGTYGFKATLSDSANYDGKTGACEPFTVDKATPGMSTTVKDTSNVTVDNANPAALGSSVHDTSSLSGQVGSLSFNGTATVTYKLFTTNDCTGPSTDEDKTVNADGTVPNSSASGALAAGDYSYQATYNGNANYSPKTSDCEPFKVSKATPGMSTIVKNAAGTTVDNANPAALGSSVHDTSSLSGEVGSYSFNGTATVTYKLFTTNDCTGTSTSEDKTVNADDTVPNSSASGALAAGSYSYQATYNGNANYSAKTSDCEPFKVSKATPGMSTIVKDASDVTVDNANPAALGSSVHDTSSLSGQVGSFSFNGTATVTYSFFTTNDCSGATVAEAKTVASDGSVPNSSATGPLGAGGYSYQATYSGNANYNEKTSPCEPFKVSKATPGMSTTVKDASNVTVDNANPAALGSSVHDTSSLSGQVGSLSFNGTATVTYKLFTTNDCTGTSTSEDKTVNADGTVPNSSASGALAAGSYSYQATYNGNANYSPKTSDCEPFKVSKATPGMSTTVKDANDVTVDNANPAALGSSVHDTSSLSGQVGSYSFNGTATVTYAFFKNNGCTGTPFSTESKTVNSNGTVPDSSASGALAAGDYSYQATYNGNANYSPKTSDCEPFKVSKATPGMSTIVKNAAGTTVDNANPAALGSSVHDTSSLSGQVGSYSFNGTATVTYAFFKNNGCTGTPFSTESKTVNSNGTVPDSSASGALAAGDYSYQATYNGNANYSPKTSDCEPFKVSKATPGMSTIVKNAAGTTVDNANPAALGSSVHDTSSLSGEVGSYSFNGTATVTYAFFKNNGCTGTPFSTESKTVNSNGTVPDSSASGALAAGDYSYQATYNGNANYSPKTSDCEPFKVSKATPGISTIVKDAQGTTVDDTHKAAAGSVVHDTATLSGQVGTFSFNGTATVTYRYFTNHTCSSPAATTQTVTVAANGSVPDSGPQTISTPGLYSYQATYNGNANYNTQTGACEPFTIVVPSAPLTPGYWKNHRSQTTALLPGIKLGNYVVGTGTTGFNRATAVFDNMNCGTSSDNSAIGCLAGHLLATKLNVKNLSDPCIWPVINKADAFLTGQLVTYAGITATGINYIGPSATYTLSSAQRSLAIALKSAMDKYNNGGGC
jgi:hypothetical protein